MGSTSRASHYHANTNAETGRHFSSGSRVATERVVHVHHDDLHHVSHDSNLPTRLHEQDRDQLINKVCELNILIQFSGARKTHPHLPQMRRVVNTTTIPVTAPQPHHGANPAQARYYVHDFSLLRIYFLDALHTRDSVTDYYSHLFSVAN